MSARRFRFLERIAAFAEPPDPRVACFIAWPSNQSAHFGQAGFALGFDLSDLGGQRLMLGSLWDASGNRGRAGRGDIGFIDGLLDKLGI
jgi:hypothetical protein